MTSQGHFQIALVYKLKNCMQISVWFYSSFKKTKYFSYILDFTCSILKFSEVL